MWIGKLSHWFGLSAGALLVAMGTTFFGSGAMDAQAGGRHVTFAMVASSDAIKSCLPKARAEVTVKSVDNGQIMTVKAKGLAPKTGYDLFVTQVPHAKFGISWYQSDLETDSDGNGTATVRGIFNKETFSISPDTLTTLGREGTPQTGATFGAVNQYHLGLWFNDPAVPFKLGCESGKTEPVITPFNGEQRAGIQVLNTSNYPDDNGPLKQIEP